MSASITTRLTEAAGTWWSSSSWSSLAGQFATAILAWAIGLVVYRTTFHPLAKYPGPFMAKITGFYAVYHAFIGDLQLDMLTCHEKYGKFVRYGPNKMIVGTSQAIQDIYARNTNVQKSTAYQAFETTPEAHDLQSTVDKQTHQFKRRVMSQAFAESALKSLEHHCTAHVKEFVACITEQAANPKTASMNIAKWVNYLSFDLMAELVFGRAFDMLRSDANRYIIDLIQFAAFRVGVCLQMPALSNWQVDKFTNPAVRKLRDQYVATSKKMAEDRVALKSSRQDLFHHIINAKDPQTGKGFTTEELWGEATLLTVAGSDAISTGMAGVFFYLSKYPEVHKKAAEEVRRAFGSPDEIKMGPKMNECVYLKACIDESMRMSPPVGGALWRETLKGGLKVEGELLPAGIDIGVPIYAIHHDPQYFPKPYEYIPERWIVSENNPAEKVAIAKKAYTPFSIGPVGCLGKNLAYMELQLTMAHSLWSLDWKDDVPANAQFERAAYLKNYKEHAATEYHLRDRFTSWKDGPYLEFSARKDIPA